MNVSVASAARVVAVGSAAALAYGALAAIAVALIRRLGRPRLGTRAGRAHCQPRGGGDGRIGLCWRFSPSLTFGLGRARALARRVDAAGGLGGEVLTAYELDHATPGGTSLSAAKGVGSEAATFSTSNDPDSANNPHPQPLSRARERGATRDPLSAGLARIAVNRTAAKVATVPVAQVVSLRPAVRAAGALAVALAVVALIAALLPELANTQWRRFTQPFADVPPFAWTKFEIDPGDVPVLYGQPLDVYATPVGAPVDRLELVLEGASSEPPLPMFPEADGRWRATLTRVTVPAAYFVRARHARSERYQITVLTVPQIEHVRLRIAPPDYAQQAVYEGPLPKEGVVGLRGTTVTVWVESNRPLGGGALRLSTHRAPHDKDLTGTVRSTETNDIALVPTAADSREATGSFTITGDGRFEVTVTDRDGQSSQQVFAGAIAMLPDHRPFIRLLQPQRQALATPTTILPIELAAEDDCGVARVQLFRSLNQSRPRPLTVALKATPKRANELLHVALKDFGLAAGDEIKLFGRVEDNDPAGAKGEESPVVTVRIISQEEFERMVRARQGLQVLMSKYQQAMRRLEALRTEIEQAQDDLAKSPQDSRVAEEKRRELMRLRRKLQKEADEVAKAARMRLPYDVDASLSASLEGLAGEMRAAADELEELEKLEEMLNEQLGDKLGKLAAKLKKQRANLAQELGMPLERLAAVVPLMADQMNFVALVAQQEDLAERLASLKGRDNVDDPALKARMRDLEEEQRRLHERLNKLLDDIEQKALELPEEGELHTLRLSALDFVAKVRESKAADEMSAAADGLSEFSGTRGHEHARKAADILAEFVETCDALGGVGRGCLKFQPSLSSTAMQMLAEMGFGGPGYGMFGDQGQPTGLYGSLGENEYRDGAGSPFGPTNAFQPSQGQGVNPDEAGRGDAQREGAAAGAGEGVVPDRYRRRVGQYFQRILEEAGDK